MPRIVTGHVNQTSQWQQSTHHNFAGKTKTRLAHRQDQEIVMEVAIPSMEAKNMTANQTKGSHPTWMSRAWMNSKGCLPKMVSLSREELEVM